MNDDRTIVGLDIGTNVIKVAIGRVEDDGKLQILSTAKRPSSGLRNGIIVNIEEAKEVIRETIEEAEQNAGVLVNSVIVAIGGSLVESQNARGVVPIRTNSKSNRREVTREDIDKVIEIATAINYPADREKIHVIPQNYLVDGVGVGVQPPVNRLGFKLEVEVHIVTASKTVIQNIKSCMLRANYFLEGVMLKTLAQTQSVCHDDEMELGSIIIDLGAGTTDVIVLLHGAPIGTASIPVGCNLVTKDIAVVTGIPISAAEKIKIESGCCYLNAIQNDDDVILPGVGGRSPELLARSQLCQIIQARMEQIFVLAKREIVKNLSDSIKQLSGNIILTGGGALMEGVVPLAQEVFKTSSVHIGIPESLGGKEEEYRHADFATVIGLLEANKLMPQMRDNKKKVRPGSTMPGKDKDNVFKRMRDFFF